MNINPLANKKPARRFFVLIMIIATAIGLGYITSRIIMKSQDKTVPVEAVEEFQQ